MAAETSAIIHSSHDINKLSYEIFSILESKFLFGYDDPNTIVAATLPKTPGKFPRPLSAGKVRILSIDAGTGVFAAVALARLEASLAKQCRNPEARIADFFDIAAGSGSGGVLTAMLFTRSPSGRPLFSAGDALRFIMKNRRKLSSAGRKGIFRRSGGIFRRLFGESTLRDTIKPVLIPCYDLATGSPFVFSRADAVEADAFDFSIPEVCAATCSEKARLVIRSVEGRTRIDAVGGGVVMRNPTAMAITHVLNNTVEFPFAAGVEDLLVVSLGNGAEDIGPPAAAKLLKIAGDAAAEMVDQAVAMAFRQSRLTNYVRIEAHRPASAGKSPSPPPPPVPAVEEMLLSQRSVDSVLFRGRKVLEKTNGDRLEWFCGELIAEHDRRKGSSIPTVLIKPTLMSRTSSATNTTTSTVAST
ncbi:patatin-like protein 3 [Dendrobium catenatum]|uniref:Patatin n=1 Tax=Dendrobium catenatum TaxID=906689 RepID=A0A2I0VDJ2_9ASPA|nr:patatin-like protein 3 [Dendrobium catenatum]PKU61475.1 Patatin group A-3 [Dendrobium catenatum]